MLINETEYSLGGNLTRATICRYLEIHFNNNLEWEEQVKFTILLTFYSEEFKKGGTSKSKEVAYLTLIRPISMFVRIPIEKIK